MALDIYFFEANAQVARGPRPESELNATDETCINLGPVCARCALADTLPV